MTRGERSSPRAAAARRVCGRLRATSRWRAILEAMAASTSVVAAAAGGNPELIPDGETGLLLRAGDAVALAEALRRLAGDAPLRGKMADAGRMRVEAEFRIERQVSATEALYEELVGR